MWCSMKGITVVKNLWFAMRFILDTSKKIVCFRIIYAILQGFYTVYSLFVLRMILQLIFQEANLKRLAMILLVLLLISFLLESLCDYLMTYRIPQEELKVSKAIEIKLYEAMSGKRAQDLEDPHQYNHFFFVIQNGKDSILQLLNSFADLIAAVVAITGLSALLASSDLMIICFVLIYLAVSLLIDLLISRNTYQKNHALIKPNRRLDYVNRIFYLKQYHLELKVFPLLQALKEQLHHWYEEKSAIQDQYHRKAVCYHMMKILISLFFQLSAILYIAYLVLREVIAKSDFLVLYNGTSELSDNLKLLFQYIPVFYENGLYIGEIKDFLAPVAKKQKYREAIREIELQDVSFTYPLCETPALHAINYRFHQNSYAIVGMNGSGKTTLAKVIGMVFDEAKGKRIVNGRMLDEAIYLDQVSYIFQDYQVYALTIAENILMRPLQNNDDVQKVEEILKKVNLYDKVMGLPHTIYTEMTTEFQEEATMFSGGELQKLALGRAIAKDCTVLILDEPSSALDTTAEYEFMKLVKELGKDKILIYITHKLDKLMLFDQVLCMKEGTIIESGAYEDLMQKKGYLYSLTAASKGLQEITKNQ